MLYYFKKFLLLELYLEDFGNCNNPVEEPESFIHEHYNCNNDSLWDLKDDQNI